MNIKDLDALNELYLSVYNGEQLLNEAPGGPAQWSGSHFDKFLRRVGDTSRNVANAALSPLDAFRFNDDPSKGKPIIPAPQQAAAKPTTKPVRETPAQREARISRAQDATIAAANKAEKAKSQQRQQPSGSGGGSPSLAKTPPTASSTVLAKQKGVEGRLDKATGKFTAGAFSDVEKSRYASVAAQNAARNSAASGAAKSATEKSPQGYAVGTTPGGTKFERRTPTRKEMDAAKAAGGGEAGVKAAVAAGKPTTGPANATIDKSSVEAAKAAFKPTTPINPTTSTARPGGFGVSTKPMATQSSASSATAPALPGQNSINNTNSQQKKPVTSSYEWPSAKTIRDIAGAYSSIYEAKKKVDQDEDGDNDFADVRIARMIASGVPKEKAIAMTKNKSYNKEEVELIDERYMGFKKLKASIAARGGVSDPGAVAASIGRKKYGKKKFQKAAATDHKLGEEVEAWVNSLIEEGYDLSDYTWGDMYEIYLNEATAMAKRGYDEAPIRQKIAKSTGGGESADRATELENRPTFGQRGVDTEARRKYARAQKGAFRDTTSSNPGLHVGQHKSNDPAVKAKQAARGAQRGVLTPREKKQLNREAYEAYEFVASYLLENNFASTVEDANVIINNMSEGWFDQIMEDAPMRTEPLWSMNGDKPQTQTKTQPKTTPTKPQTKKQPPMRDEPLW